MHAAPGHGGDAQVLGPRGHGEAAVDRLHDGIALVVVLEQVPLVEQDDERAAAFDGEVRDLLVLLGNARGRVDHEQGHIGAIDRAQAADHGVVLDVLVDGALLADARGVDHAVALAVALDHRVDGVARGARDVAHDGAIVADHLVEERGLAGVGAPDDGNAQGVGLVLLLARVLGQKGDDLVE